MMKTLYSKILAKITPTAKEIRAEKKLVEEIRKKITKIEGKHSHIEWCGSSARGTHLKGDKDLDLFLMFDKNLSEEELEAEGLRIGKTIFRGHKWEKAYSQHPYIRGEIKGFEVEVVPSFIVQSGAQKQSAVDRTPFHNKYLLKKLTPGQKQQARLLKQFLKGINAYGADLRYQALPGYGVELLIAKYKDFDGAIEAISRWKAGQIVTLENEDINTTKTLFLENHYPLIIIDPVDSIRNVASALSLEQFERMIFAAQLFLRSPSEKFFFPKEKKAWAKNKISKALKQKEIIIIYSKFPKSTLPDLVWGQLRRFERKINTHLHEKDFLVLRSNTWSDEKEVIMIFELEELVLNKAKKIFGPMAEDELNVQRFLEKKRKIISGPRVENGKIVLEIEREEVHAPKVLEKFLKNEKKNEKEAMQELIKNSKVLSEKKILGAYNGKFAQHLTQYLEGKEVFE